MNKVHCNQRQNDLAIGHLVQNDGPQVYNGEDEKGLLVMKYSTALQICMAKSNFLVISLHDQLFKAPCEDATV